MKKFFLFLVLILGLSCSAQEEVNYTWIRKDSIVLSENAVWTVDVLQNFYSSASGIIHKIDSTGILKFSQSIKSIGDMTDLLVINSMKLVFFSEQQQVLCYLDNTLSRNEDCIELGDKDIISATKVAKSDRPDRIWIFDDVNSRLVLISTESESQKPFVVDNIRGIIGEGEVLQMLESMGRLYIAMKGKGLYVFDLYGSLLNFISLPDITCLSADNKAIYVVLADSLLVIADQTDEKLQIDLPLKSISEIHRTGNLFYVKVGQIVYKYSLKLT